MIKIVSATFLVIVICASCTTYELSLGALQDRFEQIDSTDLKLIRVRGPLGESYTYLTHPDKTITLKNKSGQEIIMEVKPSLEMRVTFDGGKRSYFYLDKVYLTDEFLIGDHSRFSKIFQERIPINLIEKIEVQDGKKNFKYE